MPARPVFVMLAAPMLALGVAGAALAGQDRYGPPMRAEPDVDQTPAPTGFLTWPGKAPAALRPAMRAQAAAPARPQDQEPPPPALAAMRAAPAPRPLPASIYAPPPPGPRLRPAENPAAFAAPPKPLPVRSASAAPSRRPPPAVRPAPRPAPQQPAPTAVAANAAPAGGMPAHFYSVQREFGLKPDPIPLPAQFFADGSTNDLAGPPPPPPPHLIPGQSASSAANIQRAQTAADMAEGDAPPSN